MVHNDTVVIAVVAGNFVLIESADVENNYVVGYALIRFNEVLPEEEHLGH